MDVGPVAVGEKFSWRRLLGDGWKGEGEEKYLLCIVKQFCLFYMFFVFCWVKDKHWTGF